MTYIPQLYINHLAEKNGKEHLHQLIQSIILQNETFRLFHEEQNNNKQQLVTLIGEYVRNIFTLRNNYQELKTKIKAIGTKEQLEGEIKRLDTEIAELRKQSGFSEEEEKKYQELTLSKTEEEKKYQECKDTKSHLEKFIKEITAKSEITLRVVNSEYKNLGILTTENLIKGLKDELVQDLSQVYKDFFIKSNNSLGIIENEIIQYQKIIQVLEEQLKPFETKVTNKGLMNTKVAELNIQKGKIQDLGTKDKELRAIRERGENNNSELFNCYTNLFGIYKQILERLQDTEFVNLGEELLLKSFIDFDVDKFHNSFTELFDLRNPIRNSFNERFDTDSKFIFNAEQHTGNIKTIFDKLPKNDDHQGLTLKSSTTFDDLYTKLFDDYFKIDFSIEHKGDNILRMSPGKRGIVLLHLILHISNAKHPILIDQPEDNLDNRTIYSELKEFIKDRKTKRQIILVTHNANLVVSTDAENIIVANQAGQQIGKDKKEFQFEYVSGALENTFKQIEKSGILFKLGIREHVCDILEGGEEAFLKREQKYGLK